MPLNQLVEVMPDVIPSKLEDWTFEIIDELATKGEPESDAHDFKTDIPDSLTLTKLCCAFANIRGGFIILGVKEIGSSFMIEGIANDKELAKRFGEKIRAEPTIYYSLPKVIPIKGSTKVLAVFQIPLSPYRPHVPSAQEERRFWKRTNKGNDYMSYEEIRMAFLNYEERREKLKLLYIELAIDIEQLNEMKKEMTTDKLAYSIRTLDSSILSSLLVDLYSMVGKDPDLLKKLLIVKEETRLINTKVDAFIRESAFPTTDIESKLASHKQFLENKITNLMPVLQQAIKILEDRFGLKNPLA